MGNYELSHYIEARKILNYNMEEVAWIMHTTKQSISNLELGKAKNKMTIEFYKQTIIKLIKEDNLKSIEHASKTVDLMNSLYSD